MGKIWIVVVLIFFSPLAYIYPVSFYNWGRPAQPLDIIIALICFPWIMLMLLIHSGLALGIYYSIAYGILAICFYKRSQLKRFFREVFKTHD